MVPRPRTDPGPTLARKNLEEWPASRPDCIGGLLPSGGIPETATASGENACQGARAPLDILDQLAGFSKLRSGLFPAVDAPRV